ncbi:MULTISPECIES: DUF998 domain-containing protein [unclassified Brevibacterium]|uniref:DUF998 domain-containing protein n=1 Tax=unclassified Brevibacterium TaxID=2614124 RepID=UPI00109331C9|nr:DUF998 domain-containing protein [Brevibacterium sp. S22]TGD27954.1 DUF998 domain-containing protein [Brevibacterium sp. S22]
MKSVRRRARPTGRDGLHASLHAEVGARDAWGAILVLCGVAVFFIGQLAAQFGWTTGYSWAHNNISDLGHVTCADFEGRYICSPWHAVYNSGAVITSGLLVPGLSLMWHLWGSGVRAAAARIALTIACCGYAVAGLTPPDIALGPHLIAVLLLMPIANIGLLLTAAVPRRSVLGDLRWTALSIGLLALVGTVLHLGGPWLGLGRGGMERVAGFAPLLFLVIAALHVLRARSRDHVT